MFRAENGWEPIPKWCRSYETIGQAFGSLSKNKHFTMVLCVPSRAMVAPFLVVGLVRNQVDKSPDISDRFDFFAKLPKGSPLILKLSETYINVTLDGLVTYENQPHIRVVYKEKRGMEPCFKLLTREVVQKNVHYSGELEQRRQNLAGREIIVGSAFSEVFLSQKNLIEKIAKTGYIASIIGTTAELKHEIADLSLGIKVNSTFVKGIINDLIFVTNLGNNPNVGLTKLFSQSSDVNEWAAPRTCTIIFDGALSFLNHAQKFVGYNRIAILNKAEANFSEAVVSINQQLLTASEFTDFSQFGELPAGVELCLYGDLNG